MGPISFARKYNELTTKEGKPPSKIRMFEETRKRKEGRTYKRSNNDTLNKIKRMKEIEALQEAGLSSSDEDPFDKVMENKHSGRLRLYGRGICNTNLKGKGDEEPQVLAPEFINAIKAGLRVEMQKDLDAQKEKVDVELQVQKEKVANMQKELDDHKVQLDAQKAKMDHLLVHLQNMHPTITPAMIAEALASLPGSTSESPTIGSKD